MDSTDQAIKNFENVKEALKGIYEILNINISEKDVYFKLASDNIIALYQNFLEMVMNDNSAKIIKRKLKNCELEADIPLGAFSLNGSKKVNF
ncbi:MAG: hypothetical protein EU539_11360 [Promethearchaeota archaeon]|nr:MAG: hypothetical protein EU539_11360 [Candidatus Lokiarchaeota archaeon]